MKFFIAAKSRIFEYRSPLAESRYELRQRCEAFIRINVGHYAGVLKWVSVKIGF